MEELDMAVEAGKKASEFFKGFKKTLLGLVVILLVVAIIGGLFFRVAFVDFVDNYEIPYRFDTFGENKGKIVMIDHPGYIVTWPFKTKVHTIDGRPMQVCITSINRVLNCKLVKFNSEGLELFLEWHGRDNYDNEGTSSTLNQMLKAYAYEGSGKKYQFLTIIRELKPSEIEDIVK